MPETIAELVVDSPLVKSFQQRFEELPGWTYLAFVLTVGSLWVPKTVRVAGAGREVPPFAATVLVFCATYVLYFAGDWFDDHFWKRRRHRERADRFTDAWRRLLRRRRGWQTFWSVVGATHGVESTQGPRALARDWLGVRSGSYKTALAIARSAGESLAYGVWWPNEVAKTSRSFVIPFAAVALIAAIDGSLWLAVTFLLMAALAIRGYVTLKFAHVRRLYSAVNQCREAGVVRFNDRCLVDGRTYRLFIVDGTHVVANVLS